MLRRNFLKSIAGGALFGLFGGGLAAKEAVVAVAIVVPKQPLKAFWSVEAAADLRAWHSVEFEKELTQMMAEEITTEIDREILADLAAMQYEEVARDSYLRV